MLVALVLAAALLGGAGLASWIEPEWRLGTRLAAAAALGPVVLSLLGYLLALSFGLTFLTLAGAAVLSALPIALWRPLPRARVTGGRHRWIEPLAFVLAGAAFLLVMDRAMLVSGRGIATGDEHNFGDLPFHLAVASGFLHGNFPPEHPELAGARLTYPPLADFGLAQLAFAGCSLHTALRVQSGLLALALLVAAHAFALRFSDDRRAALVAPALLLLNGGLGFMVFFAEAWDIGRNPLVLLFDLTHDYTILRTGELRFGNAISTLLIPQRGLLMALPTALLAYTQLCKLAGSPDRERVGPAARFGLLAGLLPLAHAHSFLTVVAVAFTLALLFNATRPAFLAFGLTGLAVGIPQVLLLAWGSSLQTGNFLALELGWDRGDQNPLWFWFTNAGLFLPLAAWAGWWLRPRLDLARRRFLVPFALCFLTANLLRLSPWIWDNIKFIVHAFAGTAPVVALVLARWSRRGPWGAGAAGLALLVLTLSGALDVWRIGSRQIELQLFDPQKIEFAERIAALTPQRARLLSAPAHDGASVLAGRSTLLGYPGHIWSQGMDPGRRQADVSAIYAGAPDAAELLAQREIDFIVVGPEERETPLDERFLAQFPLVVAVGPYRLLDARATRSQ